MECIFLFFHMHFFTFQLFSHLNLVSILLFLISFILCNFLCDLFFTCEFSAPNSFIYLTWRAFFLFVRFLLFTCNFSTFFKINVHLLFLNKFFLQFFFHNSFNFASIFMINSFFMLIFFFTCEFFTQFIIFSFFSCDFFLHVMLYFLVFFSFFINT